MRISTLPVTNPVSSQAAFYHCHPAKTYPTNIQHLIRIFNFNPKQVEKITPLSHHVSQRFPFTTSIPANKDDAIRQESNDRASLHIYTDGSTVNSNVGAVVVML